MHPSGDVCMRVPTQNVHLYYLGIYFSPSTKGIKDNRKLKAKESWLEVGEKLPPTFSLLHKPWLVRKRGRKKLSEEEMLL